MIDHQEIVDEIRSFSNSSDQTFTDSLKQLASAYVTACQEVNARLRRCADFLQKGLRSEAIHLAQAEPALLDDLAVLDFPERSEWEEVSLTYGLPAPPKLNMEAAETLNEAYADALPLEGLLRQHRLLALARAPLSQRLRVMRRISDLDARNPVWAGDIQTFENVRFTQIDKETKEAVAAKSAPQVAALADEMARTKWLATPPPALKNYVESAASRFQQKKARERLENLERKLNEAHSALDLARGRAVHAQWEEACREAELPVEDALRDRVFPALAWLQKEGRKEGATRNYEAHLSELESALLESSSTEILEARYAAVKSLDGELPPEVEDRYHATLRKHARAKRKRILLIAGSAAAGLVLVIGMAAFWIYQASQARRASDTSLELKSFLDADRLTEARALFDRVSADSPALVSRPEIAELQRALIDREAKDQQRAALFQRALKEAAAAVPENPETPLLARAKKLVRLAEERAAFLEVSSVAKDLAWKNQSARDEAFLKRLGACRQKVEKLEAELFVAFDSAKMKELDRELDVDVGVLLQDAKSVSAPQRKFADELAGRLAAARTSVQRQREEERLVQRLTASLHAGPTFEKYTATLEEYIRAFPDAARSKAFLQADKERALWDQAAAWHRLVEPWVATPFRISPKDAKRVAEKCQEFIGAHRPLMQAENVDEFLQCVDAIAQQDEEQKNSAAGKLRDLFGNSAIRDLWFVETTDGKTYYLKNDPKDEIEEAPKNGGFASLRYVAAFDGAEKAKPVKSTDINQSGRAPQSEIADRYQSLAKEMAKTGWDAMIIELAKNILAKKRMDPVLQLSLLKAVLEHGAKGSYPLGLALKEYIGQIKRSGVDLTVPWIDPSFVAIIPRREAREFIGKLPALRLIEAAGVENRQKLESSIAQSDWVPTGWLASIKTHWQVITEQNIDGVELGVIVPKGERAGFEKVGSVESGKAMILQGATESLLEGRVVFARKSPKH